MTKQKQSGFTMMEMMIALAVFLTVSAIMMSGMVQMMKTQGTVANRTEMHTSVRSATELLQQEIGQAGRISLPTAVLPVTMTGPITGAGVVQTVAVSSTVNMFPNMLLDVDAGQNFEVVSVTAVAPGTITAAFSRAHGVGPLPVQVSGAFGTGIVPPAAGLNCATVGYTPYAGPGTGSDCSTLKLYGDINGDGNILYVEYKCDTSTNPGYLYRNEVANAVIVGTVKPPVNPTMYLLNNLEPNPNQAGCFSYQVQNASVNGAPTPFVTDVALTLTVQTQLKDPQTHQYQQETKALLNITPRNVFYVWEATSLGEVPRNQQMPANIATLL
jgi:prepilin-type N-terminal cleavage/methylation domain-containing protein